MILRLLLLLGLLTAGAEGCRSEPPGNEAAAPQASAFRNLGKRGASHL